jgi:AcrR family transcriptional regulator
MASNHLKTVRQNQVERREKSEAALLDSAEELFAERGVVGTTLAEIGIRAGYSRGHATFCFGTKDRLVERVAKRARDRFLREAQAQIGEGVDGRSKLVNIADFYMRSAKSAPTYIRTFFTMWGAAMPRNADPAIAEYDGESRNIMASLIRDGQRDGSISPKISPKAAAVVLLGLLRGVTGQLLISPDAIGERALRTECRRVVEFALKGQ